MTKSFTRVIVLAMGVSTVGLTSCVDNDYDLSKDIDLTVQIGSEGFTLPASDTEPVMLSQILDLKSTSSIKPVKAGEYGLAEGDYVLLQSGSAAPSSVKVDEISLNELNGTSSVTELAPFQGTGLGGNLVISTNGNPAEIKLYDNNVTPELVSLEKADLSVEINVEIGFNSKDFSGEVKILPDYKAEFDPSWTLEIADNATSKFMRMVNGHTAEFTKEMAVTTYGKLSVHLRLVSVDFTKTPGQGLVAPGKFSLTCGVRTKGDIAIDGSQLGAGKTAHLDLVTTTSPSNARLLAVTGVLDPKINVNPTTIKINDIPDFLEDEENVLDIENPRIAFSMYNSSPVSVNLNAILTAYDKDGNIRKVPLGNENGTSPIVIGSNGTTDIVVSRHPLSSPGATNIVVENLGDLIKTIPDRIEFGSISAKALPEVITMKLGQNYNYTCDYEAIIPLAFGADLHLHYTTENKDWDEDLYKYNFNTVQISADVVNSLPMVLTPSVVALDRQGNEISDVTVEISGNVAAGTISSPVTSPLNIVLKSTAENLGRLDGVRVAFDGTTDAAHVGDNLNQNQSIEFNNVRIKILGGVTVDLND